MGTDVGDVRHPGLIGRPGIKPTIERVVDRQRRSAPIFAGPALVADLRPNAGEPRQPRNPIGTATLAHIRQVVVEL